MSEKLLIEVFQAHKTENYGSKTFVPEIMGPASFLTKIVWERISRLSVAGPQDLTDVVFRIVDQSRYTEVQSFISHKILFS